MISLLKFDQKGEISSGIDNSRLRKSRSRLIAVGLMVLLAFGIIITRLINLTILSVHAEKVETRNYDRKQNLVSRPDILDRNGVVLATSLPTMSLYADPLKIINAEEVARRLTEVLPDLRSISLLKKLKKPGRFVWLARNLSPQFQFEINRLGLPGISFRRSENRVYPHGNLAAHILGLTNVDGEGVAGVEKYFNHNLRTGSGSIHLSIDSRIQSILQTELGRAIQNFKAIGGAGVVMDVESGEIIAMASLPDYNPNYPNTMTVESGFNRAAKGVYEMGSTFKLFTVATALDLGIINFTDGYDASKPIQIARFSINDYHAKKRWLSVPEIILYSSNIGAAKMAQDIGTKGQKEYLQRFGLLNALEIELPEIGSPILPAIWRPINTMTISYGHGIAVSPLQLISGVSSLVNGGIKRSPTLIKVSGKLPLGKNILLKKTSEKVRRLMRLVVSNGTGRKAEVPGYLLGGKTGTADKLKGTKYSRSAKMSSFVGVFPINRPRYAILVIVDEPKGNKSTHNFATGGWVAAPVVGRIVKKMGPIIGIAPDLKATFKTPEINKNYQGVQDGKKSQRLIKKVTLTIKKN